MPTPALLDMARRACVRNIKDIVTFGDLPYEVVKPILLKVENPHQLAKLEETSPQIRGVDAELWKAFIKRDITNWRKKYVEPSNPNSWSKVYFKLLRENKAEEDDHMAILKEQLDKCEKDKMSNTSTQLDNRFLPKLPGARSLAAIRAEERNRPGPLMLTSGSRTKMVNGKFIMDKARREAAQDGLFRNKNNALALPTHLLNSKSSQVKNIPQGVLDDYQRQQRPQAKISQLDKPVAVETTRGDRGKDFMAREQRLRDLANGRKPTPMTVQEPFPSRTPQKVTTNKSHAAIITPVANKTATIQRRPMIIRKTPIKTTSLTEEQAPEDPNQSSKKRKIDDDELDSPPPKRSSRRSGTPIPTSSTTTVAQVHTLSPSQPLVKSIEISQSLSPPEHPLIVSGEVSPRLSPPNQCRPPSLGMSPQPTLRMMKKKPKKEVNIFMPIKKPQRKVLTK